MRGKAEQFDTYINQRIVVYSTIYGIQIELKDTYRKKQVRKELRGNSHEALFSSASLAAGARFLEVFFSI